MVVRGGKNCIAPTIYKTENQANTREALQSRAYAALDRESVPSNCDKRTGRHANLQKEKPPNGSLCKKTEKPKIYHLFCIIRAKGTRELHAPLWGYKIEVLRHCARVALRPLPAAPPRFTASPLGCRPQ